MIVDISGWRLRYNFKHMNIDRRLLREGMKALNPFIMCVVCGSIAGFGAIFQARLLAEIVTRVFLENWQLGQLTRHMEILAGVIIIRTLAALASDYAAAAGAEKVKNNLRSWLLHKVFAAGPAFTGNERSGELVTVLGQGIDLLDAYFSQYIPQLVFALVIPLAVLLTVFPLDTLSGFVLALTAPLIPLFMVLIGKTSETLTQKQYRSLGKMSDYFLDTIKGLNALKLYNQSRPQEKKIAIVSERYRQVTLKVMQVTFVSALVLEWLATLSVAIVAVEIGLRLLHNGLQFWQAFFILIIAPDFYLPLRQLGARFHAGMSGVTAAKRIFEVADLADSVSVTAGRNPNAMTTRNVDLKGKNFTIQFENVTFAYDASNKPAVEEISFQIRAGQKVALVGPSGAGKSTLAQLLMRFIQPIEGEILLDGEGIERFSIVSWREQMGWLSQSPVLFHDTILENIRFARPPASRAEVQTAARLAHLDEFIDRLPLKYETMIGEGGARLSGGQAQRLALARVFLKDAPVLVMDEPSAALDPDEEKILENVFYNICKNRSALIIAHRLETIRRADWIVVLEEGRVVEAGTHAELQARGNFYDRLYRASRGIQ